jgi:hypothetical protein
MAGYRVDACVEYESRYGVPKGDLLFHGTKQPRRKDNPVHWVPICAWEPQPFSRNFHKLEETSLIPFFHVLKKKYTAQIFCYQEEDAVLCKREPQGPLLLGQSNPPDEIELCKALVENSIDAHAQAVLVFGGSLHFIPALLQTQVIKRNLVVLLIEPDSDQLSAALALYDLQAIPADGRWQIIPHMLSQQEMLSVFTRMGLPWLRMAVFVDPKRPDAVQIGNQLRQMITQQGLALTNQMKQLTQSVFLPPAKPRVLILTCQQDHEAARIASRYVRAVQTVYHYDAALCQLKQRGTAGEPNLGAVFQTGEVLNVIQQVKPSQILCIGLSPDECFTAQLSAALPIPVTYLHTSAVIGKKSFASTFKTVVTEKSALSFLEGCGCYTATCSPLACDMDFSSPPAQTEKAVVFCQNALALSIHEKVALMSRLEPDRKTQKTLVGLPLALKDEPNVDLYAIVREEFPHLQPPILFDVLDYLYRETTFLRQTGILYHCVDFPLRMHGFGWDSALSDDDPLKRCIEPNPTTTVNFEKIKRARVALNIPSIARAVGPDRWLFRFPAMGLPQICEYRQTWQEMAPMVSYFHSVEECIDLIREHLENPGRYREQIMACQEQIKQHHLYEHRLRDFFDR